MTNWTKYDAGLRARGSLTVWFTPKAVEARTAELRTGRGGKLAYSALDIANALTLRAVFRLALRQTEGLIDSNLQLLGLDLPVPDHSTLSRRAETLGVSRQRRVARPCICWWIARGLKRRD
ncbi:transposase [Belnapia sp. F-4-1]|uniref:transposase n=1 Tax=Belnapia sp. F-4-1 TaxID=1545443 RepID=UPI000A84014A|nr:transposase [Belnapia sp. F-4-1]